MKKSLFTKWTMAMVAVFSLASCGEEVIIDNNHNGKTVFAAGPINIGGEDETRTSIDRENTYYWQFNDQIWVNDGGTWVKSSDSELSSDKTAANFYYDKLMTADSYKVAYTGYNSQSATEVTIPANLHIANLAATAIGQAGDCGVATATRNSNGTYSFALQHKASYLGFAPLKLSYLNKIYRWTKAIVTDVNGKAIAGTFDFNENGLDVTKVKSPSSKITMAPMDGLESTMNLQSYNSPVNYIFAVLPPVERELNIEYHFVEASNTADTFKVSKKLNSRVFIENNVVKFRHGITVDFYRWDAPKNRPYDARNNNFNDAASFTQASNSCATMPNPNELYWYIMNGDPRWDDTTPWTSDDGATYHTGGVWIKKKSAILAEGKTFDSNVGAGNLDMRTTYRSVILNNENYRNGGKPANTSNYFFLPAMGLYHTSSNEITYVGITGAYWSNTLTDQLTTQGNHKEAYSLSFSSNDISITAQIAGQGRVAGNGSDWFK